jgi:hypothetical protein
MAARVGLGHLLDDFEDSRRLAASSGCISFVSAAL